MTIPDRRMANTSMLKNTITKKSSPCFSYLIQPTTPCVLGTEIYDDNSENDDEFFVTAGAIVHSCPNIYGLLIENEYRKLQSCDHLMFINKQLTSITNNLNTYNTEFDRYSIRPRFQRISTSLSTDSINSEIELYKERHAIGLYRKSDNLSFIYSSFLPTKWKSDNYLLFLSVLHHQSLLSNSISNNRRSRSYEILIG